MSVFRISSGLLHSGEVPVYEFDNWSLPVFYLDDSGNILRRDPPINRINLPEHEFSGFRRRTCLLSVLSAAQALCLAAETDQPMCVHILVRTDYVMKTDKSDLHIFQCSMMAGVDWKTEESVSNVIPSLPTVARLDASIKQLLESIIVAEVMEA